MYQALFLKSEICFTSLAAMLYSQKIKKQMGGRKNPNTFLNERNY